MDSRDRATIRGDKIICKGEIDMMSLLKQEYRAKKEFQKLLRDYGAKNNLEIPDTLDIEKLPAELKLNSCIDSQSGNSKCRMV